MKDKFLKLKSKITRRHVFIAIIFFIVIKFMFSAIGATGFFAYRSMSKNASEIINKLSLSDANITDATHNCVNRGPTEMFNTNHLISCTASKSVVIKIPNDPQIVSNYLDDLIAQGWKQYYLTKTTDTKRNTYASNQELAASISEDKIVDRNLALSKGKISMELIIENAAGKGSLPDYVLTDKGLYRSDLPFLEENELMIIFRQYDNYFRIMTAFALPGVNYYP